MAAVIMHSLRVAVVGLGLGAVLWLAPPATADSAEPPAPSVTSVTPPNGVPHLPSPDNLPPGATQTEPEHHNLGYLRQIWQAVRNQDVSMSDALLLIAQRPMDTPP